MKNKRAVFNRIILAIIIAYNVGYRFVIEIKYRNEGVIITSIFFMLLFIVSVKLYGFTRSKLNPIKKNITKTSFLIVVISIVITYVLGFFVGFIKNGYSLKFVNILSNASIQVFLIVFFELFRYNLIRANRDNSKFIVLLTFLITILEIQMNIIITNGVGYREVFIVITTVVIPVTIKNIMLSYLDYEVGYQPCLMYRILLETYVFFVPFMPNLGDYLTSMIGIWLPLIIYICTAGMIYRAEEGKIKVFKKSGIGKIIEIQMYGTLIMAIILISRIFPIFAVGIGSESMTGTINKGDAVIACKVGEEKIQANDVIVFQAGNKILIHRVTEIEEIDGTKYYRTKGDVNPTRDNLNVTSSMIYGKVLARIPYIAYPSVWLSERMK